MANRCITGAKAEREKEVRRYDLGVRSAKDG